MFSQRPRAAARTVQQKSGLAAKIAGPIARWLAGDSVVFWLAAILFLGAPALTAWIVLTDHREARANAEGAVANLASVLESNIARNIDLYDIAIQEAAEAVRLPGLADISPDLRRAALFSRVATAEFMSTILIIGPSGNLMFESGQSTPRIANVADRDYFKFPRDQPGTGLYIGAPIRSRIADEIVLTFSRRIPAENGAFAGIVVGSVPVHSFADMFASLRLGKGGAIALVRTDGTLLARYPATPGQVGTNLAHTEPFRVMMQQRSGIFDGVSALDGNDRIYAFRHVGELPLFVAVSYGRDTVFAAWREKTFLVVAAIASLVGFGAVLLAALRRQLARSSAAETLAVDSAEQARRSERNLALAFDRLDTVFQHSADAQFAASRRPDGEFAFDLLNRRGETITGLNADDMIGNTPGECLPPDAAATILQNWNDCLARGEPVSYDYTLEFPVGRRHWETLLVPVRDVDGLIWRLIGTIRDITNRKQAEEELHRRNLTLEQRAAEATAAQDDALARASAAERLQILGQLATGIAHDFNNVLQSVTGCAAIIERRADEPNTMRHAARLISDAAARGSSITDRLLAFTRNEAVGAERIVVAAMLADVADILRHTLRGAGRIEIRTQVDDDQLAVDVELNELKTVLLNLATNARDAMPDGGSLVLGGDGFTAGTGHPTLAPGDYVRLWVEDNGFGMDAATIARATEPFFTTKPVGQGTGIGLSMARTFAESGGGALSIDSRPGHGTTINLWLRR